MFNSRRAKRIEEPTFDSVEAGSESSRNAFDPMEDLVRLVQADLDEQIARGPLTPDELADALAAELDAPVGLAGPDGQRVAYAEWDDDALADLGDEFTPEELAALRTAPVYDGEGEGEAFEEPAPKRRLGLIAAAVAGTLLIGGSALAFIFMGDGAGFGEPKLVRAPTGPYKIVPERGDTIDEPVESDVVFNRDQAPPKGEERLVPREEAVPDLPGVNPQVPRVILPDGQEIAAEVPMLPADAGPRRVRTVTVRPDGTLIEAPDGASPALPSPTQAAPLTEASPIDTLVASADPDAPLSPDEVSSSAGLPPIPGADESTIAAPEIPEADETVTAALPEPTRGIDEVVPAPVEAAPVEAEAPPAEVTDAPADAEPAPLLPPAPAETVATAPQPPRSRPVPPAAAQPSALPSDGPLDLAATAAAPAPAERAVAPRQQVASVDPAAVAPPPAAEAAAPAPAGSAFVQVSSQRSEQAALSAFRALQKKYPGILGGLTPDVQRADLGAKGVYYRVRVVQAGRDRAASLCQSLRAVGADCLIAKK